MASAIVPMKGGAGGKDRWFVFGRTEHDEGNGSKDQHDAQESGRLDEAKANDQDCHVDEEPDAPGALFLFPDLRILHKPLVLILQLLLADCGVRIHTRLSVRPC